MTKINILYVVTSLDGGGVDKLTHDYAIRLLGATNIDFVVMGFKEGILEKELRDKGCVIHHIHSIHQGLFKHIKDMNFILKAKKYDIVHVHAGYKSFISLLIAKIRKVPVRIAHTHIAFIPESKTGKIVRKVMTPLTKCLATNLYACGRDAAIWTWGSNDWDKGRIKVLTNAIESDKFCFSQSNRDQKRKSLHIEDKIVIGMIARLSYQKNIEFAIDLMKHIVDKADDIVLLIAGDGDMRDQLQSKARALDLEGSIQFLGIRKDVPELLSAFDLFLLPSRYEGLPIVLVEAQANGLPAVVSDSVTDEIKLSEYLTYLNLNDGMDKWRDAVINMAGKRYYCDVKIEGYDIDSEARKLLDTYIEMSKS